MGGGAGACHRLQRLWLYAAARDGGESYDDGSYRSSRRSYRGSYSGHGKEEMIEQMEELMEEAGSEKERQKYQMCLKHLREM